MADDRWCMMVHMKKQPSTSWGNVAEWYDDLLETEKDTYQSAVILPNLLRLLSVKKGQKILDLACGQGFFSRAFAKEGASVTGVDVAEELIRRATAHAAKEKIKNLSFAVASADHIPLVASGSIDTVTVILSLQNIADCGSVFAECARALKNNGRLLLVLNHPAFRVPKMSEWGWDEQKNIQYRRTDGYLSESRVQISMHPGDNPKEKTISFHRPLQYYFKALQKHGFAVVRLEEWISHRQGPKGRKFAASERARKEFPLFLFLEAGKL